MPLLLARYVEGRWLERTAGCCYLRGYMRFASAPRRNPVGVDVIAACSRPLETLPSLHRYIRRELQPLGGNRSTGVRDDDP